jgi:hypothetical protein
MPRESDVQKLILDWLAAKGIFAIRMNTGAVSASHNGKKRFFRFGMPGMADILAFDALETKLRGLVLPTWIEVKGTNGQQSEQQKAFQQMVQRMGHVYILARSLEDVESML